MLITENSTAVGHLALNLQTTGGNNTAVCNGAGDAITTSSSCNTLVGAGAVKHSRNGWTGLYRMLVLTALANCA